MKISKISLLFSLILLSASFSAHAEMSVANEYEIGVGGGCLLGTSAVLMAAASPKGPKGTDVLKLSGIMCAGGMAFGAAATTGIVAADAIMGPSSNELQQNDSNE